MKTELELKEIVKAKYSEIALFKSSQMGIFSVTVFAQKPKAACIPGAGCC